MLATWMMLGVRWPGFFGGGNNMKRLRRALVTLALSGCTTVVDLPQFKNDSYEALVGEITRAESVLQQARKERTYVRDLTGYGIFGGTAGAGVSTAYGAANSQVLGFATLAATSYALNNLYGSRDLTRVYTNGIGALECVRTSIAPIKNVESKAAALEASIRTVQSARDRYVNAMANDANAAAKNLQLANGSLDRATMLVKRVQQKPDNGPEIAANIDEAITRIGEAKQKIANSQESSASLDAAAQWMSSAKAKAAVSPETRNNLNDAVAAIAEAKANAQAISNSYTCTDDGTNVAQANAAIISGSAAAKALRQMADTEVVRAQSAVHVIIADINAQIDKVTPDVATIFKAGSGIGGTVSAYIPAPTPPAHAAPPPGALKVCPVEQELITAKAVVQNHSDEVGKLLTDGIVRPITCKVADLPAIQPVTVGTNNKVEFDSTSATAITYTITGGNGYYIGPDPNAPSADIRMYIRLPNTLVVEKVGTGTLTAKTYSFDIQDGLGTHMVPAGQLSVK